MRLVKHDLPFTNLCWLGLDATHVPCDLTQDDLLQNFPWYQGQADRPVVPQILLTTLLVDGCHIGKPPTLWDLSS